MGGEGWKIPRSFWSLNRLEELGTFILVLIILVTPRVLALEATSARARWLGGGRRRGKGQINCSFGPFCLTLVFTRQRLIRGGGDEGKFV